MLLRREFPFRLLPVTWRRSGVDSSAQFLPTRDPHLLKSGNREFDFATAQALSKMAEVFSVLPSFRYFKVGMSQNAFATPRPIEAQRDGTIFFGRDLLFDVLAKAEGPETAFASILAHEFGHIVQFKLGVLNSLRDGSGSVKRSELHADFLAGYYAGVRKAEKPDFKAAVFAQTQHEYGDYAFNSRDHHGTPNERARAIVAGFQASYRDKKSLSQAVEEGAAYVLNT